ncbi:MAG: hypothetical protein AB1730_12690 [Myxococcota bacterium]
MTAGRPSRRRVVAAVVVLVVGGLFLVRHALVLRAGVWLANVRARDELEPADRVTFDVAPGWTSVIRTDMDDAWRPLGRAGANSFVFGDAAGLFASGAAREDPTDVRYQAWFGVYSVKLKGPDDLANATERELLQLADELLEADALRWAKTMGDPAPTARVVRREPAGQLHFLGHDVTLYVGEVATHSDLGDGDSRAARFLGRAVDWRAHVRPYHPLTLEGFVAVRRDAARQRLYVAWGNGVRFVDASGIELRTWPAVRDEVLMMAHSARVE